MGANLDHAPLTLSHAANNEEESLSAVFRRNLWFPCSPPSAALTVCSSCKAAGKPDLHSVGIVLKNRFPFFGELKNFMSQHRSLRGSSTLGAKRNVLKRFERVEILKKRGQWKEGDRVTGLRKTRVEG